MDDDRLAPSGRVEWRRSDDLASELLRMLPEEKTGVTIEQDALNYVVAWFMLSFEPPWERE